MSLSVPSTGGDPPVVRSLDPLVPTESPATQAVVGVGFGLECGIVHHIPGRVRLRIPRLKTDPEFADRVVDFLDDQPGIESIRVNADCASLVVQYVPDEASLADVLGWLAGSDSKAAHQAVPADKALAARRSREASPSPMALVCAGLGLGVALLGAPAAVAAGLVAIGSVPIAARAIYSLLGERRVSVDTLDTAAIGVLLGTGDIFAAGLTASLIAGGEYIRALTARRSRRALIGLLATTDHFAWVVRGNRKHRLPAAMLAAGDEVVVYPGEQVLVDGIVIRGRALVDQRVLTGESKPVLKTVGDEVLASTVLTDGQLYVQTKQVGGDTRAQRIVQILEGAPTYDTRMADYARRAADRMVVPTLLLAGGMYLLTRNVGRLVSIVVFDFATGIRVSMPTTVLASMAAAVREGILIKSGRAVEQLARIDTIVFDKTGTLTSGEPHVTDVQALGEASADDILTLAAALESRLTHPAAMAIVELAQSRNLVIPERGKWDYLLGQGVSGEIDGALALIGSREYVASRGVSLPTGALRAAAGAGREGSSTVFVARSGEAVGFISYADVPREESHSVMDRLRRQGIHRLIMVTGDNSQVAHAVARQVGIDEVRASVFPEEKAEIVRDLQREGHVVAVVGDGINDSPALAYADVSVALHAGSDVARETADVVIHDGLNALPEAISLARASMAIIRQNLAIVVAPNAVGLAMATAGLLNPVVATIVNNGSTIAAAANGLRPLARR